MGLLFPGVELMFKNSMIICGQANNGATWNPSDKSSQVTLSGGNLITAGTANGVWGSVRATKSDSSSKRYFEIVINAIDGSSGGLMIGIGDATANLSSYCGSDMHGWSWQPTVGAGSQGLIYHNAVNSAYGSKISVLGTVVGILFDFATGNLTYYVNGVSQGNAYTGIAAGTYLPMISCFNTTVQQTARFNNASWTHAPGVGEVQW